MPVWYKVHKSTKIFEYGYRVRSVVTNSYHLSIDDIKLYARSEKDINSMTHLTMNYNADTEMSFWVTVAAWWQKEGR